jgi:UBX domain-containing protein 1
MSSIPAAPVPAVSVRAPTNRFASLSDYNQSNDDDDEERQNFFAGGEKSFPPIHLLTNEYRGLSIQNPNQSNAQDEVRNILNRAMQAPTPQQQQQQQPGPSQPPRFTGTGYTLGSDSQPSQPINMTPGVQRRPAPVRRVLTLWRNGFTIDDGRLFPFSDPETVEILREIRMGRVPRNIAGVQVGEDVEMKLEKRETEDWTPGARQGASLGGGRPGAFIGQGNRLGRF